MASVTEDSLNLAAHQIVLDYVASKTPLNDGVLSKVSSLGLNRDQTERLIERTNSEAFIKGFPGTSDFVVADPAVIFNDSTSKTASNTDEERTTYAEYLNRDLDDIFGIAGVEKTASYGAAYTNRGNLIDIVYRDKISGMQRVEEAAKILGMEDSQARLWDIFKTAACGGSTVASMEEDMLLANGSKPVETMALFETLVDKLASTTMLAPEQMKRASVANFNPKRVVLDSDLICAFREVLNFD